MDKRTSQLGIIVLLVAAIASRVEIASANPVTTLAAPIVVDKSLKPGSTFLINVTIAEAQKLFGYQFILSYNTNVLSAIDYASYYPFSLQGPSEINDTAGYVALAASSPMGDPNGLTILGPVPIAGIYFIVDHRGTSVLDLHDTVLADVYGEWIAHDIMDGFFANIHTNVPDVTPISATQPHPPEMPQPKGDQSDQSYVGAKLTETYSAKGASAKVHVYENYQRDSSSEISFWINLLRYDGTYMEFLQIGFFKHGNYSLYVEHSWGTLTHPLEDEVHLYSATVALSDHLLEIVEVAPETFEARIDSHIAYTYTFTHVFGNREYTAFGESRPTGEPHNSLRGHFWNLKWLDSNNVWHPWQQVEWRDSNLIWHPWQPKTLLQQDHPYSAWFNSSDDFYTWGGGHPGDINGDLSVTILDVSELSAHWSNPRGPLGYDSNADINGGFDQSGQSVRGAPDGNVGISDLAMVSAYWCGPPRGPSHPPPPLP